MTYKEFIVAYSLGVLDEDTLIEISKKSKRKKILTILSRDKSSNVRYCVVCNPNTSVEVLELLSKDESFSVRYYVTRNPNTPIKVLELLSKDESSSIRWNVAGNSNTSVEVLELLSKDKVSYVSAAAVNNLIFNKKR